MVESYLGVERVYLFALHEGSKLEAKGQRSFDMQSGGL